MPLTLFLPLVLAWLQSSPCHKATNVIGFAHLIFAGSTEKAILFFWSQKDFFKQENA